MKITSAWFAFESKKGRGVVTFNYENGKPTKIDLLFDDGKKELTLSVDNSDGRHKPRQTDAKRLIEFNFGRHRANEYRKP